MEPAGKREIIGEVNSCIAASMLSSWTVDVSRGIVFSITQLNNQQSDPHVFQGVWLPFFRCPSLSTDLKIENEATAGAESILL
jgi:hypothetical protein